jgi:molybdopterin synthase sulfur carrier subunit
VTVTLRLFAAAREAAARSHDDFDASDASTVDALLAAAEERYGPTFADVLARSRVWVNGDEPSHGRAVLPPVSGGIA